jgi:hypothetical protein
MYITLYVLFVPRAVISGAVTMQSGRILLIFQRNGLPPSGGKKGKRVLWIHGRGVGVDTQAIT